jgi:hypothetical protein
MDKNIRGKLNMRKLIIPVLFIIAVLFLSVIAVPVSAGFEPTPFQPRENEVLNMVKGLSVVNLKLEKMLIPRSSESKGVLNHRLDKVHLLKDYLGDLYQKLEEYVAALPDSEPRGRKVEIILEEGLFDFSAIVETLDDFLDDPGESPDREFIAALVDLRLAVDEVGILLHDVVGKVMDVGPSPFRSHLFINDNDWDFKGQKFVLNLSMNRGLANAGKHTDFEILIILYIVGVNPIDWDSVKLKIDENGWDINDEGWDMTGKFGPLKPINIPWDRDGGTFSGVVSVQASAAIIGPSGNVMGHAAVSTSEIEVGREKPDIPSDGDSP